MSTTAFITMDHDLDLLALLQKHEQERKAKQEDLNQLLEELEALHNKHRAEILQLTSSRQRRATNETETALKNVDVVMETTTTTTRTLPPPLPPVDIGTTCASGTRGTSSTLGGAKTDELLFQKDLLLKEKRRLKVRVEQLQQQQQDL